MDSRSQRGRLAWLETTSCSVRARLDLMFLRLFGLLLQPPATSCRPPPRSASPQPLGFCMTITSRRFQASNSSSRLQTQTLRHTADARVPHHALASKLGPRLPSLSRQLESNFCFKSGRSYFCLATTQAIDRFVGAACFFFLSCNISIELEWRRCRRARSAPSKPGLNFAARRGQTNKLTRTNISASPSVWRSRGQLLGHRHGAPLFLCSRTSSTAGMGGSPRANGCTYFIGPKRADERNNLCHHFAHSNSPNSLAIDNPVRSPRFLRSARPSPCSCSCRSSAAQNSFRNLLGLE